MNVKKKFKYPIISNLITHKLSTWSLLWGPWLGKAINPCFARLTIYTQFDAHLLDGAKTLVPMKGDSCKINNAFERKYPSYCFSNFIVWQFFINFICISKVVAFVGFQMCFYNSYQIMGTIKLLKSSKSLGMGIYWTLKILWFSMSPAQTILGKFLCQCRWFPHNFGIIERKNSKWGGSIRSSDSDEKWQILKNPPNREAVSHPVIQIRNGRIWKTSKWGGSITSSYIHSLNTRL